MAKEGKKEFTQQEIRDLFGELYKALDDAYWSATTIVDKDRIRGIQEGVFDILTELNRAHIQSNTEKFKELVSKVDNVNKRLDTLKADIDKIVQRIEVAVRMTKIIDKVLTEGVKYFKI
ncbi:hypothetical protein B188_19200 [Candidatus Brocadiaceae bacterium B188]|nr:hypothetical protein [Candidatus Brocadia sapporoensis]QQR66943.1 MAG: hypothetical protein IPI25_01425 [Candidatus Brocadia sp.]RZV58235.1 MAG: hypothetical protein EX330_05590 [Candidatus Brocadia sp. BROELEC01]TWU53935.1 hypothetical protein B188_19200 [Candidatus Brocadiaceae bacterium B188]